MATIIVAAVVAALCVLVIDKVENGASLTGKAVVGLIVFVAAVASLH
jgi:hypothetical protein